MGLVAQAIHCLLRDEAIISLGPVDSGNVYPSLYFYASVFFLFFSLSGFLFWVSTCAAMRRRELFVINASVTKIGHSRCPRGSLEYCACASALTALV